MTYTHDTRMTRTARAHTHTQTHIHTHIYNFPVYFACVSSPMSISLFQRSRLSRTHSELWRKVKRMVTN